MASEYISPDILDNGPASIDDGRVERHVLCSGVPADYAGVAAVTLASKAWTPGDSTVGDDPLGRAATVKSIVTDVATAVGTPARICLVDDTNTTLRIVSGALPGTPADTVVGEAVPLGAWIAHAAGFAEAYPP